MMYISIFPVAISIRRTNVYEEESLGIYAADQEENPSFLGTDLTVFKIDCSNAHTATVGIRFVVYIFGLVYHLYCRGKSDTEFKQLCNFPYGHDINGSGLIYSISFLKWSVGMDALDYLLYI
jgi:Cation transport protein